MRLLPPPSTFFPYTTLFRSHFVMKLVNAAPASGLPSFPIALLRQLSSATAAPVADPSVKTRSEEHTSELQSRFDLVCRLLLDTKNLCTRLRPLTLNRPKAMV